MSKTIIIFYSSIGHGHISAAQVIQDDINRQDPAARVLLQDIRMFMPPAWRKIDERLYWFIAKNCPECFENLFRSMQAQGNDVPSLSVLPKDYPEKKVLAYLTSEAPDAVLATHYEAALVLGTLRERGCLLNLRIGCLHTDFFEGCFPRISMRIDRTFLAHAGIESRWLAAGIPTDKVVDSGMPVQFPSDEPESRENKLKQLGLLLACGREGAIDHIDVVENVARYCRGPIQLLFDNKWTGNRRPHAGQARAYWGRLGAVATKVEQEFCQVEALHTWHTWAVRRGVVRLSRHVEVTHSGLGPARWRQECWFRGPQ